MNADTLVIILALMFAFWGFLKGALKEIFSLLAYGAAFFFSAPVTNLLLAAFKPGVESYMIMQSAGRVAVWFIIYFIIILAGKFIESRFMKKSVLRLTNRAGGGAIGFLKAAMLSAALMWSADVFISLTGAATPGMLGKSRIYNAAIKKNLLMKTEKVQNLKKLIALAKFAEKKETLSNARLAGASISVPDSVPGEIEDILKDIDLSQIEKLLKDMPSSFPGLKLPANMDI
ncbi:MAG: CvpA family protein, partial [Victivallaceae bacterium]|nr:CvpA family protein [Victivallaceae bacterium]